MTVFLWLMQEMHVTVANKYCGANLVTKYWNLISFPLANIYYQILLMFADLSEANQTM